MASVGRPLIERYRPRSLPSLPLSVALVGATALLALLLPANGAVSWWPLVLIGVAIVFWHATAAPGQRRDAFLLPLTIVVAALGLLAVMRIDPHLGERQAWWLVAGTVLIVLAQPWLARFPELRAVTYPWVIAAVVLFALLQIFGQEINGARLWFHFELGPLQFNVQPGEFIKLFMVFFTAAYLARFGDEIGALRPSDALGTLRLVGPPVACWGVTIAELLITHDVGMAGLYLGVFLIMLYVGTRRADLVIALVAVFALCGWFVAANFGYVQARIAAWHNPWSDPLGRGYQAEQGYFSLAAGGLLGTGYHMGRPGFIPDAATDYVFATWAEEFGLIGAAALLALYLAFVVRSARAAFFASDRFVALVAIGCAAIVAIQVFVIVGGVIGLIPLTGITLPLFSYGGSSAIATLLLIDLVWLASSAQGLASVRAAADVAMAGQVSAAGEGGTLDTKVAT